MATRDVPACARISIAMLSVFKQSIAPTFSSFPSPKRQAMGGLCLQDITSCTDSLRAEARDK